ncbi:hypothetical protein BUALT_Bualt01G0038000 [Buddleja alternifolia]|uniref:BRI1 kinase inhibitor 1 n=1 Tax=Buddleja alternifolia TaxID=168488 RepID=A0AAV6YCV3_9LAMI|nr:hypothetical protein BUALT_Bualt01G0038000 [Buddleja alternifolia]
MEIQHPMLTERQEEKQNNEGKIDEQQIKQQAQLNPASSSSSSSSSPSHEFSFTISLHPTATKIPDNINKSPPPSFAIDLSPADEIFFHGHLLPLHLLSHFQTISPRSSRNSLDSFTLPIKELSENNHTSHDHQENNHLEGKGRRKSKSFSLFGLPKWKKRDDDHQGQKSKFKFDVGRVVKRYMRLVKPYLSSLTNKRRDSEFQHNYSFSGNLKLKKNKNRDFFSAPASMSVSPTNSGLLVASGNVTPTTKSDSTMEELQAAIQAAIAHCKKSIAKDDKVNFP